MKDIKLNLVGVCQIMVNDEWIGFGTVDDIHSALNDTNKDSDALKSVFDRI